MTFNLDKFEITLEKKTWDKAWAIVSDFLKNADRAEFGFDATGNHIEAESDQVADIFKKFAVHILNLFLNSEAVLSQKQFEELIISHATLHHIFSVAGFETTDLLLKKIDIRHSVPAMRESNMRKLLCMIGTGGSIDLGQLVQTVPVNMAVPAMIGYLSFGETVTERQYTNIISLYDQLHLFDRWEPTEMLIACLSRPYFVSSYIDYDKKNDLRKKIGNCYSRFIRKHKLDKIEAIAPKKIKRTSDKPALFVVLEKMRKDDDMYRTWSRRIRALRQKFYVIVIADPNRYNLDDGDIADEKLLFDYTRLDFSIKKIKNLVKKYDIKMAFYPAIGMSPWAMLLASMRIVPIQTSGLGVMGPPELDGIGFVLANEDFYSPEVFEDQKFVCTLLKTPFTLHERLERFLQENAGPCEARDKIIVGVVGGVPKVGYTFLKFIDDLCQTARFPVEIKMFSHAKGINRLHLKKSYESVLKTPTTFFGFLEYQDYLKEMMSCDVFLNPFPFGHANVLVDILMLGKPFIALKGKHPASRVDAIYAKSLGMGDTFIANDKSEYQDKFLEYCKRIQAGERVFYDRDEIKEKLYKGNGENSFVDEMMWVYKNGEELKSTKDKLIIPKDF